GRWADLLPEDRTYGFTRSGYLTFAAARNFEKRSVFDTEAHWLRARLESGSYDLPPLLRAVLVNAVCAQRRHRRRGPRLLRRVHRSELEDGQRPDPGRPAALGPGAGCADACRPQGDPAGGRPRRPPGGRRRRRHLGPLARGRELLRQPADLASLPLRPDQGRGHLRRG